MMTALKNNRKVETDTLQTRFDFALTKKLGIVKLPSAFWMNDPKINPRTDHLFWAALLLKDHKRIDMALSVMAVELMEKGPAQQDNCQRLLESTAKKMVHELVQQFSDPEVRKVFEKELRILVPDLLSLTRENPDE